MTCPIVKDPRSADAFLVPAWLGTLVVLSWQKENRPGGFMTSTAASTRALMTNLSSTHLEKRLPYLNETSAPRHVFFCSVDSQFVFLGHPKPSTTYFEKNAIWIHLGDDEYTRAVRTCVRETCGTHTFAQAQMLSIEQHSKRSMRCVWITPPFFAFTHLMAGGPG
eukprot:2157453-Prymnesium_polylepis.1